MRRKSQIPAGAGAIATPEKERRGFRPFGRRGESEQSIPTTPSRGGLTTVDSNVSYNERPFSSLTETPSRQPQPPQQSQQRDLPQTPDPDSIQPSAASFNRAPQSNGVFSDSMTPLQPTIPSQQQPPPINESAASKAVSIRVLSPEIIY